MNHNLRLDLLEYFQKGCLICNVAIEVLDTVRVWSSVDIRSQIYNSDLTRIGVA
jgi:hypothetical protein